MFLYFGVLLFSQNMNLIDFVKYKLSAIVQLVPESVAPLCVLPGVVASGSSRGSSPMENEALLGSPIPEVSSPSLSAEMANFGSKLGRGP